MAWFRRVFFLDDAVSTTTIPDDLDLAPGLGVDDRVYLPFGDDLVLGFYNVERPMSGVGIGGVSIRLWDETFSERHELGRCSRLASHCGELLISLEPTPTFAFKTWGLDEFVECRLLLSGYAFACCFCFHDDVEAEIRAMNFPDREIAGG